MLSWNTSTLLNRITVVCQSLRLPPELRDSLLTGQHRPLLSHCADIPHRLECLKEYLGLPGVHIALRYCRGMGPTWLLWQLRGSVVCGGAALLALPSRPCKWPSVSLPLGLWGPGLAAQHVRAQRGHACRAAL